MIPKASIYMEPQKVTLEAHACHLKRVRLRQINLVLITVARKQREDGKGVWDKMSPRAFQ